MATITLPRDALSALEIRDEIDIAASPAIVFAALLDELAGPMQGGAPFPMKLEPWPGGRWYRDLGHGAGHCWARVHVIKPPTLLELIGPMARSYPAINHIQYRLRPEGGGTRLSVVHRAIGHIRPEHRARAGRRTSVPGTRKAAKR